MPIPGTYNIANLEANAAAAEISLSLDDLTAIEKIFPLGAAAEISLSLDELAAIDKIFPLGAAAGGRHDHDRSKELNV